MSLVKPEKYRWVLLSLVLSMPPWTGTMYADTSAGEDELRAVVLFQLAQYVHWPEDSVRPVNAPLRFCVWGKISRTVKMESILSGKSIQGRPISLQKIESANQLSSCDLAFLDIEPGKKLKAAIALNHFPAVLLVGESKHFAEIGGMVNLVVQSARVSFEINVGAAEKAHLEFRSQLLRFARLVGTPNEKGDAK
jgi:hypothetical protein